MAHHNHTYARRHSLRSFSNAGGLGAQREFMYILQLDDYMIFYIPSSGKKRIHRLGGKAADSTVLSDKNSMIHLSVHLMADTSQSVTFAISPFTTLDTVLRQLCIPRERANSGPTEGHMIHSARSAPSERTLLGEKVIAAAGERAAHASASSVGSSGNPSSAGGSLGSSSESDGSERGNGPRDNNSNTNSLTRKKKFNSVSKMHAKITFLESTANFYPELSHWLDFFANKAAEDGGSSGAATSGGTQAQSGPSSNPTIVSPLSRPQIKRGHRRSKSSSNSQGQGTVNPLSFAFFAKRTTSEHRSSATFIPLTERMKGTIYECFTAQVHNTYSHAHFRILTHALQELNDTSAQKPLRLYVYFSDTPPTLAEIASSKTASLFGGNNRTITLSDNIIHYLSHLVIPNSPKLEGRVINAQAALSEMIDSVQKLL